MTLARAAHVPLSDSMALTMDDLSDAMAALKSICDDEAERIRRG